MKPMKAMVLAAGLGTRLRPLTNDRPKALVELAGRTMLDITLARLRSFGIHEAIINTHHHAQMIEDYLAAHHKFGMNLAISREETLLDTGGGLNQASWFFLGNPSVDVENDESVPHPSRSLRWAGSQNSHPEDAGVPHISRRPLPGDVGSPSPQVSADAHVREDEEISQGARRDQPFLLHNVDILSTIDLDAMLRHHVEHNALATLATQHRQTSRYLLFDQQGLLCGRQPGPLENTNPQFVREVTDPEPLAFAGIHILSNRIFSKITEQGAFSIIPAYLRLASQGERIQSFNADPYQWRDLGTPAAIAAASNDLEASPTHKKRPSSFKDLSS